MKNYPKWLNEAIIYNIFPASFYDSNGDGIGDLPGIIEKLDYIQSLGVNLVWINPIYDSPFQDGGYDVRDYYRVAKRYGTNTDVSRLCREAKKRGLRIMLDLVPGHTSIEHPWFKASASGKKTKYDNRYIWTDHIFRGTQGPFLGGDTERSGKYLVNFFSFQPSLNYGYLNPQEPWQLPLDHPDVVATRDELKKIMDFWLRKGVSGFRVDLANSLVKDDEDCKGLEIIYSNLRSWMDQSWPEAVLLAEWSEPKDAIRCGFHMDFILHSAPAYTQLFRMERDANVEPNGEKGNSFFRKSGDGQAVDFLNYLQSQLDAIKGCGLIAMPTGNHDLPRIAFNRSMAELKVAYLFIFTLPVVPSLYYGDEIGMRHLLHTPNREGAYPRAGCRTPMQWEDSPNAGFSTGSELYLPVDSSGSRPTVALQQHDEDSLLQFMRRLIRLRNEMPVLGMAGGFEVLHARKDNPVVVYRRWAKGHCMIVALNPSGNHASVSFEIDGELSSMLVVGKVVAVASAGTITLNLAAVSGGIFELRE
jgi:maltose alpha-D-glucosyltransferase/alpha-amylase